MHQKITIAVITSILSLILVVATVSLGYAVTVEWTRDNRLTQDGGVDWTPSITATTDGKIWVVWRSDRTGDAEIFYKVYDGTSWSNDTRLTSNPVYEDTHPSIMQAKDGKIWVVWTSNKTGDQNLYYKVFDGSTWSADMQLTTDPYADAFPSIMQAKDGKIWVAWTSNRVPPHDAEIFYKVYDGTSWSNDTRVTTDSTTEDWDPSIMQATDGTIWVAFTKTSNLKEEDIYYKRFNGTAWSVDVRLTWDVHYDSNPSIMQAKDGTIWVVWNSDRNEHDENLYYKVFDGVWSSDTKLTTDLSPDMHPSITQATDQTIWIVWGTVRLYNWDIYYKTSTRYERHDIAVTRVSASPTIARRGENVSIEVTVQNQGTFTETFQVRYYTNSTQVGSRTISLPAGQSVTLSPFYWNTSGVARGKYVISASSVAVSGETDLADNSLKADGLVEIRIMGDICGMYNGVLLPIPDGIVGIDDFGAVAMPGHIWTQEPTWDPVWGPACDVDRDGKVGIGDLMEIAIHFGET